MLIKVIKLKVIEVCIKNEIDKIRILYCYLVLFLSCFI